MLILKSFKISLQVAFFFHQVLYNVLEIFEHKILNTSPFEIMLKISSLKKDQNKDPFSVFFFCLPAQLPRYTV